MTTPRPILVVGDVTFRRFVPHFRKAGIPSVLLSYKYSSEAHLADATEFYNEELTPDAVVQTALRYGVRSVLCRVSPAIEPTIVRDALVKEVLERQHGIPVVAPPLAAAAITADKGYTRHFLAAHGFAQPGGRVVTGLPQLLEAAAALRFPCVLKAPALANSDGVKYVAAPDALKAAYAELGVQRVILEEFLVGDEIGIEVIGDGKQYTVFPPALLGRTGADCNPQRGLRVAPFACAPSVRERVERLARAVAAALGSEGLLEIDMVVQAGQPFILELNGRPGGVSGLSYATTGVDPYGELFAMAMANWQPKLLSPMRRGFDVPVNAAFSAAVRSMLAQSEAWVDLRTYRTHDILTLSVERADDLLTLLTSLPEGALPVKPEEVMALWP